MARAWHEKADRFLITHAHSFGTDTQNDYNSQRKCRTMLSIIIKLEFNKLFIVNQIIVVITQVPLEQFASGDPWKCS